MRPNRREFLKTASAGVGWTMLGGCAATIDSCREQIENRPVRRNVNSLSPTDPIIEAYKAAVTAMKALPDSDRRSWNNQALIHQNFCPHGNWLFLPWHRCYLLYFERICQKLSGMEDFALPYWNWSSSPQIPSAFWGDTTNPLFNPTRVATSASTAAASAVGPAVVDGILGETSFELFGSGSISAGASQRQQSAYGQLEATPHNYVHGFVGGQMSSFRSPLDPLFWLHHNMVERTWVHWNFIRNNPNPSDPAWLDREFTEFCDQDGNPVTISVGLSLLFPVISYRYDDSEEASAAAAEPAAAAADRASQDRAMWRKLGRDTRAARDENTLWSKRGARFQLDVLEHVKAAAPLAAAVGQPAAVQLMVEPSVLARVRTEKEARSLLVFDDVSLDFSTDFSVRVFLNHPQAGIDTPPDDPHFVGSFSSFHHDHGQGPGLGRFVLDAGPTLERLGIEGGPVEVDIVLAPFPDRPAVKRELAIGKLELQIARNLVEVTTP